MEIVSSTDIYSYEKPYKTAKNMKGEEFAGIGKNGAGGEDVQRKNARGISGNTAYEMRAEYAEDYSEENPVIRVVLQTENGMPEEYHVDIRKVNPKSATEIEMFALCSYADANGAAGQVTDSWQTLSYYRENALGSGYLTMEDDGDFKNSGQNWELMVQSMEKEYMDSGLYKQALDGKRLLEVFEAYSPKGEIQEASEAVEESADDNVLMMDGKRVICIGILNLDNGISLYIADTGEVECVDDSVGRRELWKRTLTKEELQRADAITKAKYGAYLYDESFWDAYLAGRINTEMLDEFTRTVEGKRKNSIFEGCPKAVKEAWLKAEKDMGVNSLGVDENGKIQYISAYVRQMLVNQMQGNAESILGDTKESAIEFAKKAMDEIETSLKKENVSRELERMQERERKFYIKFIENLNGNF